MLGPEFPDVLRGAANGDGAAFARLWRDMHPPLLRYLHLSAGDAAEDLASDVWLEIARRITRFRGGEPEFRSWLFTVARRRVIDRRRYETRHPELPTDDTERLDRPAIDDTAALALEGMSTQAALAFIASLPRDQAEIIVLRVVAGLDAAQVARIVGKSPGAVRVAAHRGLRRLIERLDNDAPTMLDTSTQPLRAKTTAPGQEGVTLCARPAVPWLRWRSFPASGPVTSSGGHPTTPLPHGCLLARTPVPMPRLPSRLWRKYSGRRLSPVRERSCLGRRQPSTRSS